MGNPSCRRFASESEKRRHLRGVREKTIPASPPTPLPTTLVQQTGTLKLLLIAAQILPLAGLSANEILNFNLSSINID